MTTPDKSQPRISITISEGSETRATSTLKPSDLKALAIKKNRQTLSKLLDGPLPAKSSERELAQKEARSLVLEVIGDVAAGNFSDGYQLGTGTEEWFQTANRKPRLGKDGEPVEKQSQASAIRSWLGKPQDQPIVMSELELVEAALRAAKEQKARRQSYSADDLIREGIAMIAQTLISKRVAEINAAGPVPDNLPGAADHHYLNHLEKLRVLKADPKKWFSSDPDVNPYGRRRGDKITVSILARACATNDNQIRTFLKRHGITDVHDPKDKNQD